MLELNKIYCMDCLEGMKYIDSNSIDLIWTDPPYNIGLEYNEYDDTKGDTDYYKWCSDWIKESHRILKPEGSIYIKMHRAKVFRIGVILEEIGFYFQNNIIWYTPSAFPQKTRYANMYESILFYSKAKDKVFNTYAETRSKEDRSWTPTKEYKLKGQMGDVWVDITKVYNGVVTHPEALLTNEGAKIHPCQMPLNLARRSIKFSTNVGDIVVDLFAGSGTTLVAAKQERRNFIGFEIDAKYVELCNKRLQQKQIFEF